MTNEIRREATAFMPEELEVDLSKYDPVPKYAGIEGFCECAQKITPGVTTAVAREMIWPSDGSPGASFTPMGRGGKKWFSERDVAEAIFARHVKRRSNSRRANAQRALEEANAELAGLG